MSPLNGGLPKQANESMADFIAEFIDHITPAEWRILAQLPQIRHVTELVAVVCFLRGEVVAA